MAKQKYDGVIEAIHVDADGQLVTARIYECRGVINSDHILVEREALIKHLKDGQTILTGKRIPYMGANFETGEKLHVVTRQGKDFIIVGEGQADQDKLTGLPLF